MYLYTARYIFICSVLQEPLAIRRIFSLVDMITKAKFSNICDKVKNQSKITEPYLITFELSKMDIYLDDISLKLYVIYLIT